MNICNKVQSYMPDVGFRFLLYADIHLYKKRASIKTLYSKNNLKVLYRIIRHQDCFHAVER